MESNYRPNPLHCLAVGHHSPMGPGPVLARSDSESDTRATMAFPHELSLSDASQHSCYATDAWNVLSSQEAQSGSAAHIVSGDSPPCLARRPYGQRDPGYRVRVDSGEPGCPASPLKLFYRTRRVRRSRLEYRDGPWAPL